MKMLLDEVAEQVKRTLDNTDPEIILNISIFQACDLIRFLERNVFYHNLPEAVSVQLIYNRLKEQVEAISESAADS
jgi:hypothetical protein